MTDDRIPLSTEDPEAARLDALRDLYPEAFPDGELDLEALRLAAGAEAPSGRERFGLSWVGKTEAVLGIRAPTTATLKPRREESVDFDRTENLFIEGDNLEVLKLLQKPYHAAVKLIYIDPPYNTGNDFIYEDDLGIPTSPFQRMDGQRAANGAKQIPNPNGNGRFHSRWLSMMYPRLFLAKNLLRPDGVIFVSIDDHEAAALRLLMDEVFGEENFIAQLVWEKGRKNDAKLFSVGHEYMLVYARSLGILRERKTVWREPKPGAQEIWDEYLRLRRVHGEDNATIEAALQAWYRGLPKKHPSKALSRYRHVDKDGPWRDRDISWPGGGGPRYNVFKPGSRVPCRVPERGWGFSHPEEMDRQIRLGLVEFRDDPTEPPFRKAHLKPTSEELDDEDSEAFDVAETNVEDEPGVPVGMQVMGSYIYKQSQVAVKYLRSLMGAKVFDNPKDHEVLKRLIRYVTSTEDGDIVLDFFAGSGTTAHAVLAQNAEDGGNRRFILVQVAEETSDPAYPTIADIAKERVRRAAQKITEDADLGASPQDRGFKSFALSESNFRIWDGADVGDNDGDLERQLEFLAQNVLDGATEEDLLFEIMLKGGVDLNAPRARKDVAGQAAWSVGDGGLFICVERLIREETIRAILAHVPTPERVICLDSAFEDNDALKANTVLQMRGREIEFRTI